MPLADIPAEAAFVGAESFPVAGQPVGLVVEHIVTLRAVRHASTVALDVALPFVPRPSAEHSCYPVAWAFLFFSDLSVVYHVGGWMVVGWWLDDQRSSSISS